MVAAGGLAIAGLQLLLNRTKLGLAIRAVAKAEETARPVGVNFTAVVLITFAIGSALAAYAGIMNGLYYNESNFGMGLYLGVIGFAAAIIGGLGSIYGAILGGFLFAALQTIGTVALPFASAYKDVFAFTVVIALIAWRPTGLIQEKISERVSAHVGSYAKTAGSLAAGRRRSGAIDRLSDRAARCRKATAHHRPAGVRRRCRARRPLPGLAQLGEPKLRRPGGCARRLRDPRRDRKSTRLNSSHT